MPTQKPPQIPPPTESVEQICLFRWAEYQAGKHPELAYMYHVPNGGMRAITTAKRLRAEGVKSGVPDIVLPVPRGKYHGLYIELKRLRGNTTTPEQDAWLAFLTRQGYLAKVAHGWEEAAEMITAYITEGKQNEASESKEPRQQGGRFNE